MSKKTIITITSNDLQRLEKLLEAQPRNMPPNILSLEEELNLAEVVEPENIPPTVVTMNSVVRFKVNSSTEEFTQTLVYPKDIDGSSDKISILAPVGSALLGMSEGDEIEWPKPDGGKVKVRIVEIVQQPERSGEYHR